MIIRLKIGENVFISNQFEILIKEKNFYEFFYKIKNVNLGKFNGLIFFNLENIFFLMEENKILCEGLIIMDECLEVLKDFKFGKILGIDGFLVEFY